MSFLDSPPFIYNQMNYKGKAAELNQKDMVSFFTPMTNQGWFWNSERGIISPPADSHRHMVTETPWIHAAHGTSKRCGLDHQVLFNMWRVIPHRCLNCWKTVVSPKNFEELVQLERLQEEQAKVHGLPCKCGIEVRDYAAKFYGGYYYADSLDEGYDMYRLVKEEVAKNLSEETAEKTILKRGCTEYEFVVGDSRGWHITPTQERIIELVENYVELYQANKTQQQFLKDHIHLKWMVWAHMNADFSYTKWNDGEKLFPGYVTYHDKEPAIAKQELALAQAQVKYKDLDPEKIKEMLGKVFESAEETQIDPNVILDMADTGYNKLRFEPIQRIPDELAGDDDELS